MNEQQPLTYYPNDGGSIGVYTPEPDPDQEQALNEERTRVAQAVPFLAELIEWFDAQIDAAQSIANIDLKSKLPADSQVLAMQKVCEVLTSKRDELHIMLETWKFEQQQKQQEADRDAA